MAALASKADQNAIGKGVSFVPAKSGRKLYSPSGIVLSAVVASGTLLLVNSRPTQVTIATALMCVGVVSGVGHVEALASSWRDIPMEVKGVEEFLNAFVAWLLVCGFATFRMWVGRRWARFGCLAALLFVVGHTMRLTAITVDEVLLLTVLATQIAALALMFTAPGNAGFHKR